MSSVIVHGRHRDAYVTPTRQFEQLMMPLRQNTLVTRYDGEANTPLLARLTAASANEIRYLLFEHGVDWRDIRYVYGDTASRAMFGDEGHIAIRQKCQHGYDDVIADSVLVNTHDTMTLLYLRHC